MIKNGKPGRVASRDYIIPTPLLMRINNTYPNEPKASRDCEGLCSYLSEQERHVHFNMAHSDAVTVLTQYKLRMDFESGIRKHLADRWDIFDSS
jgi:hypothetical protein